jgi:hypothetical protein
MVSHTGLEPVTPWLKVRCSTNWANGSLQWLARLDSNQGMTESKSVALPLGYGPICSWWRGTDSNRRTLRERIYSPPRLATSLPLQKWWLGTESNRRHEDFQSSALPTELPSHVLFSPLNKWRSWRDSNPRPPVWQTSVNSNFTTAPCLVAGTGFEPATFGLWARRATELLHPAIIIYGGRWRDRTADPLLVRQVLSQLS